MLCIISLPQFTFGQWSQKGMDLESENTYDFFGWTVSLSDDGNILAVGNIGYDGQSIVDSGQVRVYQFNGTLWQQLGTNIEENTGGNYAIFGGVVDVSSNGNILAVGANRFNGTNGGDSGRVYIYQYNGTNWTQLGQFLEGDNAFDLFGSSLSLSDDGLKLAIGANGDDNNGSGSGTTKVYEYFNGSWNQIGLDINGEAVDDNSGTSVKLNGSGLILAVGAISNDGNGSNSGHVRTYQYNGSNWIQIGTDIDGESSDDRFGEAISLNEAGNKIVITSRLNDGNGTNSGHARVFEFNGSDWAQLGTDIDGEATEDFFGKSVSMNNSGSIIAVGANGNDGNGIDSGHVRVFEFNGSDWIQAGIDIDGEAAGDSSGYSVDLNGLGNNIVVGAISNDGVNSIESVGHVKVYNNSTLSIIENSFSKTFSVYPNPTKGIANILLGSNYEQIEMSIIDYKGLVVSSDIYRNVNKIRLNTKKLSTGIYIVKILSKSEQVIIRLIVE